MSKTIPYDPSLVLGNVLHPNKLKLLKQLPAEQVPIGRAQEELDLYILEKKSLDMTKRELINMNIPPSDLRKTMEELDKAILNAAKNLAKVQVAAGPKIAALKKQVSAISESIESPIDYNKTQSPLVINHYLIFSKVIERSSKIPSIPNKACLLR